MVYIAKMKKYTTGVYILSLKKNKVSRSFTPDHDAKIFKEVSFRLFFLDVFFFLKSFFFLLSP